MKMLKTIRDMVINVEAFPTDRILQVGIVPYIIFSETPEITNGTTKK